MLPVFSSVIACRLGRVYCCHQNSGKVGACVAADDFALHKRFSMIGTTLSPLWCGDARQRGKLFWGRQTSEIRARVLLLFWGFSCKNDFLIAQCDAIGLLILCFIVKMSIFVRRFMPC